MKKKLLLLSVTSALLFSITACGKTETPAPATEAAVSEAAPASTEAVPEATEAAPEVTSSEAVTETAAASGLDKANADMADSILAAVAAKDLEALADLVLFPTAVNDEVVETREDFIALGADAIFTEALVSNMATVDVSTLILVKAGVVLGDVSPFIIFTLDSNNVGGITGMATK